ASDTPATSSLSLHDALPISCILGSAELRTWLWNRARSFVFSTAPSPVHVAFLQEQIARTRAAHGSRDRLGVVVEKVRRGLAERGVSLPKGSFGPIVSLHCGSEGDALGLAGRLREAGILAQAIRPPTVPARESRVRLVLGAALDDLQTTNFIEIVARETLAPEKSCIEDA